MDIYAGKDWIVIWRDNVREGYDRVKGSIGMCYDEIKGVTISDQGCDHRINLLYHTRVWYRINTQIRYFVLVFKQSNNYFFG